MRAARPFFLLSTLTVVASSMVACGSCGSKPSGTSSDASGPMTAEDVPPANALVLPAASIAKAVNPENLPAYAGPTGAVEGTITIVGDAAPETPADFSKCPDAEKIYGHAFRDGPPIATNAGPKSARALADVVIGVTGYKGFIPEKSEVKTLEIKGCAFEARTVTMTFGQRLEVKNVTKDFWTPKLHSANKQVMMMASPGGDPVKLYPTSPGHHLVFDHDRQWAIVDVYTMLYPLHAVTDVAGHYRIDGLPVGKLKVSARHPRIESEAAADLDVHEGVVHKVDLRLELHEADGGTKSYDAGKYYPPLR